MQSLICVEFSVCLCLLVSVHLKLIKLSKSVLVAVGHCLHYRNFIRSVWGATQQVYA